MILAPSRPVLESGIPLQVYLDSSDYSVFAAPPAVDSVKRAGQHQEIMKLVDDGLIQVRHSVLHVIEMTHLEPKYLERATGRARCLEDLCRGSCYRFFSEIKGIEARNALAGKVSSNGILNDQHYWFPNLRPVTGGAVRL